MMKRIWRTALSLLMLFALCLSLSSCADSRKENLKLLKECYPFIETGKDAGYGKAPGNVENWIILRRDDDSEEYYVIAQRINGSASSGKRLTKEDAASLDLIVLVTPKIYVKEYSIISNGVRTGSTYLESEEAHLHYYNAKTMELFDGDTIDAQFDDNRSSAARSRIGNGEIIAAAAEKMHLPLSFTQKLQTFSLIKKLQTTEKSVLYPFLWCFAVGVYLLFVVIHTVRFRKKRRGQTEQTEPQTDAPVKKRKTWLWVLGWIFLFPVPLGILLKRYKGFPALTKVTLIVIAWMVWCLIPFSISQLSNPTIQKTDAAPTTSVSEPQR